MVFEKILGHLLNRMKQFYRAINKTGKTALLLVLALVSFSCVSTRSLMIEIPEKAKSELPENIQSLLLISRVYNDSYTDLETESLQKLFYLQRFNYDTVIHDMRAIDTTLKALGELLFESGRYDFVIPEERFQPTGNSVAMASEMQAAEIKDWCETYKTDAVLSLDFMKTRVMTEYDQLVNFDQESNSFYDFSHAEMKVSYEALFRVYDAEKEGVIYRKFLRDTILWDASDRTASALFSHFTPVKDALAETGIAIALDVSAEISPAWRTEYRKYFVTGDENLKLATALVDSNQWETAIAMWKNLAETAKQKSVKSKAEFNLAVGYEMTGDIDAAIQWGLKSFETMYRTQTYEYLEILKNRKNELQKLQP